MKNELYINIKKDLNYLRFSDLSLLNNKQLNNIWAIAKNLQIILNIK